MTRPILAGYCTRTADRGPVDFAVATARATRAHVLAVAIHSGSRQSGLPSGGRARGPARTRGPSRPRTTTRRVRRGRRRARPRSALPGRRVDGGGRGGRCPHDRARVVAAGRARSCGARQHCRASRPRCAVPGRRGAPRLRSSGRRDHDRRRGVRPDRRRSRGATSRRPAGRRRRSLTAGDHGLGPGSRDALVPGDACDRPPRPRRRRGSRRAKPDRGRAGAGRRDRRSVPDRPRRARRPLPGPCRGARRRVRAPRSTGHGLARLRADARRDAGRRLAPGHHACDVPAARAAAGNRERRRGARAQGRRRAGGKRT